MPNHLALHGGAPVRSAPFPAWPVIDANDEAAVLDVLRGGKWGVGGQWTSRFEEAFAAMHGTRFGVGVNSGTSALRIALLAAGIAAGDEVIVPPFTFIATASAVAECNAVPVFVDIHPDTYNLDPGRIEAAITPRTRAIIPVHFAGLAADMERINATAKQRGLRVIEDAAHAHGGCYKGRMLGSWGDMSCFSFQSSKNLASGEGGLIATNDEGLTAHCRAAADCGRKAGGAWYEHHTISGNYRLSQFQGALLLSQMRRLEEQTRRRDQAGRYLDAKLGGIPGIRPLGCPPGQEIHPRHLYMLRFDEEAFGLPRGVFHKAVTTEGIPMSLGYPIPLPDQPLFVKKQFGPYSGPAQSRADLDYSKADIPVARRACSRECCWLTQNLLLGEQADLDDVIRAIAKVHEHRRELMT